MPKFEVSMNLVEAKKAKFVVEADSEDTVWDVIGEIEEWEDRLEWHTSDYEPPIVDSIKQVTDKKVTKEVQKTFDEIVKNWVYEEKDS